MQAVLIRSADPKRRRAEVSLARALGGEVYRDQDGRLFAVVATAQGGGWPIAATAQVVKIKTIPESWTRTQ